MVRVSNHKPNIFIDGLIVVVVKTAMEDILRATEKSQNRESYSTFAYLRMFHYKAKIELKDI